MVHRLVALSAIVVVLIVNFSGVHTYENYPDESTEFWMTEGQKTLKEALWQKPNLNRAKNIIVFIGDGMGVATVTAARIYKGQKAGKHGEETRLGFENFPHVSLIKTYALDRQVPDSAATATSLFCGVKTNYYTLGLSPKGTYNDCLKSKGTEIESMLTWAQKTGRSTGIVTTTRLTHATPASLYSHSASRKWEADSVKPASAAQCKDIASQLIEDEPGKNLKVILGGGRKYFQSSGPGAKRKDGKDLIEDWKKSKEGKSYQFVSNQTELLGVDMDKIEYLFGIMSEDHLDYDLDRERSGNDNPSIKEMTKSAIQILKKNDNGFFLHVEGGRIDHAHHASNAKRALQDTLAFEDAIMAAVQMTDPKDTLIIVTADHSHVMTINGYPLRGHDILGMGDVSDSDNTNYTTLMYTTGPGHVADPLEVRRTLSEQNTTANDYIQMSVVPTLDETHGGEDVALYAVGPYAHLFHGVQEQNYIAHAISYASCMGPNTDKWCAPINSAGLKSNAAVVTMFLIALFTHFIVKIYS